MLSTIQAVAVLPFDVSKAAVAYSRAHLRVVAVHGIVYHPDDDGAPSCTCPDPRTNGTPGGRRCPDAGKHPALAGWQDHTPAHPDDVRYWYARHPAANVGLAMGGALRLVAIDVDGDAGRASLNELQRVHDTLPTTLTSQSGRRDGGMHMLFRVPAHLDLARVRNRAGRTSSGKGIAPGVDVRAEGGQIVVAPSLHSSGARYRWTVAVEPAELPEWLYRRMVDVEARAADPNRTPNRAAPSPTQPSDPQRYARVVLRKAAAELAATPSGNRNDAAAREAFGVGGFLWTGAYTAEEALAALLDGCRAGGWDVTARGPTAATLRRQLQAGARRSRSVPAMTMGAR